MRQGAKVDAGKMDASYCADTFLASPGARGKSAGSVTRGLSPFQSAESVTDPTIEWLASFQNSEARGMRLTRKVESDSNQ